MLRIKDLRKREDFSYCLRKNPFNEKNKKGFKKRVGSGRYHAYFPRENGEINPHEFIITFYPEGDKNKDIEQFPICHITDPSLLGGGVMNFLASAWKTPIEEEEGDYTDGPVSLEFFLFTERKVYAFGVQGESKYNAKHVIQEFPSLYIGLNWFLALMSYLKEYLNKEDLKKAAKNCNNGGLGYYARYLLSKDTKENIMFSTESIELVGGNTALQRRREIQRELENSNSEKLFDLGAGSLYVCKKFIGKYEEIVGIDSHFSYKTKRTGEEMGIQLIESHIEEWEGSYEKGDVIVSEVLEHNSKEVASEILNKVLDSNPNQLIITVPNREFNKNFNIDISEEENTFRHEDHKWEPSKEELIEFLPKREKYSLEVRGIGDRVEDENITLMAIYKKV